MIGANNSLITFKKIGLKRLLKLPSTHIKLVYFKLISGSQSLRKKSNKIKKSINGNIKNLKILHWNKGKEHTLEIQMAN